MKNFKIKSESLIDLTESIQELVLKYNANVIKNPLMESDGIFSSVVRIDNDFDPSKISSNVIVDDEDKLPEEKLNKKENLINQAKSEIETSLKNDEKFEDILQQIKDINKDLEITKWKLNDEGNTAFLDNKNAQIFLQNGRICLSYKDQIQVMDTVEELHKELAKNNLPMPKNIKLHEAKKEDETQDSTDNAQDKENYESRLRKTYSGLPEDVFNILFNDKIELSKQKEKELNDCVGGTSVSSLGSAVQYTGKPLEEEEELEEVTYGDEGTWLAGVAFKDKDRLARAMFNVMLYPERFFNNDENKSKNYDMSEEYFNALVKAWNEGGHAGNYLTWARSGRYSKTNKSRNQRNIKDSESDFIRKRSQLLNGEKINTKGDYASIDENDIKLLCLFDDLFGDDNLPLPGSKEILKERLKFLSNQGINLDFNLNEVHNRFQKGDLSYFGTSNERVFEKYEGLIKNIIFDKLFKGNRKITDRANKIWNDFQNIKQNQSDNYTFTDYLITKADEKIKNIQGSQTKEEFLKNFEIDGESELNDYTINLIKSLKKNGFEFFKNIYDELSTGEQNYTKSLKSIYNFYTNDKNDGEKVIELLNIFCTDYEEPVYVDAKGNPIEDYKDVVGVGYLPGMPEEFKNGLDNIISGDYKESSNTSLKDKILNILNSNDINLQEDQSPEDFAVQPETTSTDDVSTNDEEMVDAQTSNDTDDVDLNSNPDLDSTDDSLDGGFSSDGMPSIDYSPEGEDEENDFSTNIPETEYRIIDVLMSNNNNPEIRLKVKNLDTGEIETKSLSEIDV